MSATQRRASVIGSALGAATLLGAEAFAQTPPDVVERWSVGADVGAGATLVDLPRIVGATASRALSAGLWVGFAPGARVMFQLGVRGAALPDRDGNVATSVAPGVGLRVTPWIGAMGRMYVEGALRLAVLNNEARRFATELALGLDLPLGRYAHFGPVLRYTQVVQPDRLYDRANEHPDDARWITLGLSVSLHTTGTARPALPPPPAAEPRSDLDGDNVDDAEDQCARVPVGDAPDPARRGCPMPIRDRDGDGLDDDGDRCADVPVGPHADPSRPGCPAVDTDQDGLRDPDDRCPITAQGPRPDPARPGCPESARVAAGDLQAVVGPLMPIRFGRASDRIVGRPVFETLDRTAARLRLLPPETRVEVDGHSEPDEDPGLSTRRASAVRDYLLRRGLSPQQVVHRGLGSSTPDTSATARGSSRRVTLRVQPAQSSPP